KIKGEVVDLEWKKSFISKAKKYQKDIVPVYIEGRNSDFFYNLSSWRNKLGVKANIEMLYLADEFFSQRNQRVTIKIGKKIPIVRSKVRWWIWNGKRVLFLKRRNIRRTLFPFISKGGIRISFTTCPPGATNWVSRQILKCCIWQMNSLVNATKELQ